MKGKIKKILCVFLTLLIIMSMLVFDTSIALAVGNTIGSNTQKHVVSSYESAYASYKDSYLNGFAIPLDGTNGNPDMVIPGLSKDDDMVPQGLTLYKEKNLVFVTSYMGSNTSHTNTTSVIYALDFTTGNYVNKFNIYKASGAAFTAHAGGIGVSGNNLYICDSASKISYIPLSELDCEAGTEKNVKIAGTCDIGSAINNSGTSYLSLEDGILWTGNFYEPSSDDYKVAAHTSYNSLILGYDLNGYNNSKDEWNALVTLSDSGTKTPSYVIKCPNDIYDIQSLVVKDGKIYIGTSWGRKNDSKIYVGTVSLDKINSASLTLANSIKVNAFSISNIKEYTHLPMTEGMFIYKDDAGHTYMYNGFESAAYYYYGYASTNKCPKPTDVIWKINIDEMDKDALGSLITNKPTDIDSGLSLKLVASEENDEFVTRVMRASGGAIGTVYYAKAGTNGNLTTNDSFKEQNYILLKAENHSSNNITISKIESPNENILIGKDADTTGTASTYTKSVTLGAGGCAYFKVTSTSGAFTGAFTVTYKMSGLNSKGSAATTHTAKVPLRIIGNISGSESYYNKNNALDILAMAGWNSKSTYTSPYITSTVKYSSAADISRMYDNKDSFTLYVNKPSTFTTSNIDSSGTSSAGFGGTPQTSKITYNINAAKYSTLLSAKIIWSIGVWKDNNNQIFVHNQWTNGIGTVKTSDSKTQYPAFNINNDDFNSDVSNATVVTKEGTTDTYLTGLNLKDNLGKTTATNEIHMWNGDSRGATRVIGKIETTFNAYDASALATLVNKCESTALVSGKYDSTLWDNYQAALSDAINKVGAYAQTQSVIDASYATLENAYNALINSHSAEIYEVTHALYTAKKAEGIADKSYVQYYLVMPNDSFTPSYITDDNSKGYTLSLSNKIDGRDPISAISVKASTSGVQKATYNYFANEYNISFVCGDNTLAESKYMYASTPSFNGETPTKEYDETYHYVFKTWSPEIDVVTKDQVYTASFTSEKHTYGEYIDQENATCQGNATEKAICNVCNRTDEREILDSKLDHVTTVINAVNPDCTNPGYTGDVICVYCNEEILKGSVIEPNGHTTVVDEKKEPTCTEDGFSQGAHCSVCNTIIVAQTVIPATGHILVPTLAVEPTCTKEGNIAYWTCSECNKIYSDDEGITEITLAETVRATIDHTYVSVVTNPTCTADGYTTHTCSACGDTYTDTMTNKLGHTFGEYVANNDATCENDGTKTAKCIRCDAINTTDDIDSKKGHTWNDGVVTLTANCVETGTMTYTCTVEGCNVTKTETILVDANNHKNVVTDEATDSTCTAPGKTEGSHCTACNTVIIPQQDKELKAHTWDAGVVTTPATCNTKGVKTYTCTACNTATRTEDIELDANNHENVVTDEATESTCTAPGKTEGSHCSVCNTVIVAQQEKELGSHVWNNGEVVISATCHSKGEIKYTCTACNVATKTDEILIDPNNHTNVVTDEATESTCTVAGKTEGKHCEACNTVIVAQQYKELKAHTWDAGEVTTPATCSTKGVKTYTCTECNTATRTEDIELDANNHENVVTDEATESTCTAPGKTEGSHCTACNTVIAPQQDKELKAHTWNAGEVTTPATCSTKGVKTYTCIECNTATRTEDIKLDANNHKNVVTDEATESTCIAAGKTEGKHCEACNTVIVAQQDKALAEHTWNEGNVTNKANCVDTGIKTYVCTVEGCSATKDTTIEVDNTNHKNIVVDQAIESTCTETGKTEGKHCEACSTVIVPQSEIKANGHTVVIDEKVDSTCTDDGLTEGKHCSVCNTILVSQEIVKANGHTIVKDKEVESTCIKTGLTEGEHCTKCDYIVKQNIIDKASHTETTVNAKDASCKAAGYSGDIICKVCNTVLTKGSVINKLDHTPGIEVKENVIKATCKREGSYDSVIYCTVCHEEISRTPVNTGIGDHIKVTVSGYPATCTSTGLTDGKKCDICGEILEEQEIIKISDHISDNGTVIKEASCLETGIKEYKCKTCNIVLNTETLGISGHTEEIIPAVKPTDTQEGLTEGIKCAVCGKIILAQQIIPVVNHKYKLFFVSSATCTEDGIKVYMCSECGEKKIEKNESALGHIDNNGNNLCDRCEEHIPDSKPITCSHMCHQKGIKGFIWKILVVFYKIFGSNKVCECGLNHY